MGKVNVLFSDGHSGAGLIACACYVCKYVRTVPGPVQEEEDVGRRELEVDSCELLCECWELNQDPLNLR